MLGMPLELHQSDEVYRLVEEDLELLRGFRERTVFTIGTKCTVPIYRQNYIAMTRTASRLSSIALSRSNKLTHI